MATLTFRTFTASFKTKVCLESLKEQHSIEVLAKKFDIHPNRISAWKRAFIQRSEVVFEKPSADQGKDDQQNLIASLYARMREWTVTNDFLKKSLMLFFSSLCSMIDRDHKTLSIRAPCALLGLSRCNVYYSHGIERAENLQIAEWLKKKYLETPFLGAKNLLNERTKLGFILNIKNLRCYMKIQGRQTFIRFQRQQSLILQNINTFICRRILRSIEKIMSWLLTSPTVR